MTLKYRTEGFVFKKEERLEADQAFAIFTKDFGRIDINARAIRKTASKLRPNIDLFYLSEIEFIQGRHSKTLTDAIKIKKSINIFEDYKKLKAVCQMADVMDIFLKGQEKDIATFDLLVDVLNKFKESNNKFIFHYFFWNFLSLQGYCLQTKNCAHCHNNLNPNNIYFSNKEGGVVCGDCVKIAKDYGTCQKINSDVVKILRLILQKDWQILSKLKVEPNSQKLLETISENATRAFCPAHC
jgi:DNA repair protein RecO (recombination protein O)